MLICFTRASSWKMIAMPAFSLSRVPVNCSSAPLNIIAPVYDPKGYTPARTFISVDLPAPFSPTSAWISPRFTLKLTSLSALTPENSLVIWFISRMKSSIPSTFHISLGPARSIGRVPSPPCPSKTHCGERASPLPGSYNDFLLVDVSLQEVSASDQRSVNVLLGDSDGNQQDRRHIHFAVIDGLGSIGERLTGKHRLGCFDCSIAKHTSVLEDGHTLGTLYDTLSSGQFSILTGDRNLAGKTLSGERLDAATGCAIVRSKNALDVVLVGRQRILHDLLCILGLPLDNRLVGNNLNGTLVDKRLDDTHGSLLEELGIVVGRGAGKNSIVALRNSLGQPGTLEHADLHVIK